jgi:hypothetical protein
MHAAFVSLAILQTLAIDHFAPNPTTDEPPVPAVPSDPGAPPDPEPAEPPPPDATDVPPTDVAPDDDLRAQLEALQKRQAETEAKLADLNAKMEAQEEARRIAPEEDPDRLQNDPTRPMALGWDKWTAGNAMATRVTFAFGDDNLLAGPRDRSPEPGFTLPNDRFFFEQLTQEKRGYETETQLVVYKRMRSYFKHLDAEAAMVIEFENFTNNKTLQNQTVIGDDGSYLKLNYYIKPNDFDGDVVSLTMFPFDSQRFLLGYTYQITWGGERIFPNNPGQVPGLRLKYDWNRGTEKDSYVFVGAKTARLLNDEINETQTYWGALGGFGLGITKWLAWELSGGYFQRGAFPPQGADYPGVGGRTAQAFGGSTRLTFKRGTPVGTSIDFQLFKYAPDATFLLTAPQDYNNKIAFNFYLEFTALGQTLLDWDQPDKVVLRPAFAGASINRLRIKKWRVNLNAVVRDLSFILFNIPGLAPYRAYPAGADTRPDFFIAGGFDYFFEKPKLTPGAELAYRRPATYTSSGVTTVVREFNDFETLPPGEGAFDIFVTKATLKWDVAPFFVIITELRYSLDRNRTKFVKADNESGRERVFQDANVVNRLGFFILAQARW